MIKFTVVNESGSCTDYEYPTVHQMEYAFNRNELPDAEAEMVYACIDEVFLYFKTFEDFVNALALELKEDEVFSVSSDDLREWQLANVGLTEADVPYECRQV